MRFRLCLSLIAFLALSGCATEAVTPPEAIVFNNTNQPIKSISYRLCDQPTRDWIVITASEIPVDGELKVVLPYDCVDLQALSASGQLLGAQSDVKRKFPFRWKLF